MAVPEVTIVLSSYNGERYIAEQIESILQQTFTDWELLVRDDGSTDGTRDVIRSYIEKDTRIRLMDDSRHIGVRDSFNELLCAVHNRPYVMYADQDDVWIPEKISITLERIKQSEQQMGTEYPLLVHGAITLTSEAMEELPYNRYPTAGILPDALFQCPVMGCSMMINRKLMELSVPISSDAYMPDYWIALVAVAYGRIEYIEEPLLYHRLHLRNSSSNIHDYSFFGRIRSFRDTNVRIQKELRQNIAFCEKILTQSSRVTGENVPGVCATANRDMYRYARDYLNIFKGRGLGRIKAIQRIKTKNKRKLSFIHTKYVMMHV